MIAVVIIAIFFISLFVYACRNINEIFYRKKIISKNLEDKILFKNKLSEFYLKLLAYLSLLGRTIFGITLYQFWVWLLLIILYFFWIDLFKTLINYWWIWTPIIIYVGLSWADKTMLFDYIFETQIIINKFINNLALNQRIKGENALPSVKEIVNNELEKISKKIIENNDLNLGWVVSFDSYFDEYDLAIKMGFNKLYEEIENLGVISYRVKIPSSYEILELEYKYKEYQTKSYYIYNPIREYSDSEKYLIEKFKHYRIRISRELVRWLKKEEKRYDLDDVKKYLNYTFNFKAKDFAKMLSKLKMEKDYIFEEGGRNCHERIEIIESMEEELYKQLPKNFYETKQELENLYLFFYSFKLPGLIKNRIFNLDVLFELDYERNYHFHMKCYPYFNLCKIFDKICQTFNGVYNVIYYNPYKLPEYYIKSKDEIDRFRLSYNTSFYKFFKILFMSKNNF